MAARKPIPPREAKGNKKQPTSTTGAAPELLTGAEVAALLRVHPKQVYRLLRQGLPGLRVGGEWRFVHDDVLAWASQRAGTGEPARESEPRASEAPARIVVPDAPPPLVAANGDVVIELLLGLLPRAGALTGLVQADRSTGQQMLQARRVLAAGVHGGRPPARLGGERLVLLYLAEREVGVAFARGLKVRHQADVVKRRVATRPLTAGVRHVLDGWLDEAGMSAQVNQRATEHASHQDVVWAVARGEAEVGVTTGAWARRAGLGFLPLASEPYALALFASSIGTPAGVALCETAQGKAFRDRLAAAGGYTSASTGTLRFED